MNTYKNFRISVALSSVIIITLGIILTLNPEMSIKMICYGVALAFIALGIINLIGYLRKRVLDPFSSMFNLITCIFLVLLGLFIFIKPDVVAAIIPIILGLFIMVDGAMVLFSGIAFRTFLPKKGLVVILVGIFVTALGASILFNPFETEVLLMTFIGISLIISGATNLINQLLVEIQQKKNNAHS